MPKPKKPQPASSATTGASPPAARTQPSATSQTFLAAVLLSSIFSLSLNVYLSAKLGVLQDLKSVEQDFMSSFTQGRTKPEDGPIKSATEHHGEAQLLGDPPQDPIKLQVKKALEQIHRGKKKTTIPAMRDTGGHNLAGLSCEAFGGPAPEIAQEMVYWEDIPSDNKFVSPFKQKDVRQYLSFEPDDGGWYVTCVTSLLFLIYHPISYT